MATASCAPRRRCRSRVAALAASSWLASSTIGNPCVGAAGPARGLVAADQREQLAHRAEALERGRDGRILVYGCHAKCRQALTVPAAPERSQYCSPGASSRRPAGRRAASWQLTSGSSLRIAQRHWSEGEMGASLCTDVMPSADKLSRCLLPQSARSTVLQERLLAGRPAGARPRGS